VTDALTGKPATDAEVTVVVVDEAVLALLPYPLPVSNSIICCTNYNSCCIACMAFAFDGGGRGGGGGGE
jgi:hypothetical protein